jgi:hypothetical protein
MHGGEHMCCQYPKLSVVHGVMRASLPCTLCALETLRLQNYHRHYIDCIIVRKLGLYEPAHNNGITVRLWFYSASRCSPAKA